jgi:hypothetical protein
MHRVLVSILVENEDRDSAINNLQSALLEMISSSKKTHGISGFDVEKIERLSPDEVKNWTDGPYV